MTCSSLQKIIMQPESVPRCRPRAQITYRRASRIYRNTSSRPSFHTVLRASVSTRNVAGPTANPVATPTHTAPTTKTSPATAPQADKFTWTRNWWPAMPVSYLDPARPTPLEVLGTPLVIWQDGSGTWRCFKDACPHRLAPLSEGRVEGGELMCSYHGWRFSGPGACTSIPQAPDPKALATATASPRSCATAFPTQEAGGLLWVWPDASPTRWVDSAAAELPLCNASREGPHQQKLAGDWFMRELPYDFDVLVENLTDPSHLPFSHHNLTPILNRYKAPPMPFHTSAEGFDRTSPDARSDRDPACSFAFPSLFGPSGRVSFHPPGLVTYAYTLQLGQIMTVLYAVPVAPGRSRVFNASSFHNPNNTGGSNSLLTAALRDPKRFISRLLLQSLPRWGLHLNSQRLFDGDSVFLAGQSHLLRARETADRQQQLQAQAAGQEAPSRSPLWASAYFMPMSCDRAVVAARKWIDSVGGGGPAYAPEASPAPATVSRQELLDRYEQHTKHCPHCRSGLASVQRVAAVCRALLAVSFLALCCCAGTWGPTRLIAGGLPSAATAAAALLGALAAAVGGLCERLRAQFYFTDHVHADNH